MKILDIFFKKKKSTIIEGVKIHRSFKRSKTVSLKIKNGKAIIYCPNFSSDDFLREIILKKKSWIQEKLNKKIEIIEFSESKNFPIFGKNYKIRFSKLKNNEIKISRNTITISSKKKIKMKFIFLSWLKEKAKNYLTRRVSKISKSFNIHFKSVVVKTYKARWGCCNTDAVIFLNWKLVLLPKEVIDYVIIHELSHILVPNHSKKFWATVQKYDENYFEKKNWLKENGNRFIQFN